MSKGNSDRIVSVETVDRMTEHQISAKGSKGLHTLGVACKDMGSRVWWRDPPRAV